MASVDPNRRADVATETWELAGPFGPETWIRRNGCFVSVEVGTVLPKRLALAENSFDIEQLQLRRGMCAHEGPWPNALLFCPECGTRLAEPAALPRAESWAAPFGTPTGLPMLDELIGVSPMAETRRQEKLPGAADLGFIVAGRPPTLFAYDLPSGMLRARREADASWQDLEQLPRAHHLPRWSWSAAILQDGASQGFALATNDGPVMVHVAPDHNFAATRPSAQLGVLWGLGGVASVAGQLVMPVRHADGLALANLAADSHVWTVLPVSMPATMPAVAGASALFAAPVVHYSDAFWCSERGLLSVSVVSGGLQASFQTWASGLSPVLAVRPLQSDNGTLYQLMRRGEQDPVFHSLVLPDLVPELREYRVCLCTGNAVFADGKRRRLPWEDTGSRGEYTLGDDEFILPLLAFPAQRFLLAVCSGRSTLSRFIDTERDPDASRGCQVHFSPATKRLVPLNRRFAVRASWDIVPFVFRGRLYIYGANRNECWSWALQQDAPST